MLVFSNEFEPRPHRQKAVSTANKHPKGIQKPRDAFFLPWYLKPIKGGYTIVNTKTTLL